ncbi:MAG: DNA polymerase I [Deltaproteobacteria bacterium]|nr:DNA polymerase I [Deltaproteobacteria bacterium]
MAENTKPTLELIDASSYVYRAYHAIPSLSTSKGVATNAVYGFTNMVLKALRERDPSHVALVFDARGKTFRDDLYPEYKANRTAPPDDLASQFPLVRQVAKALNVRTLEVQGVEADDVIGTLTKRAVADGFKVVVITGDKDFMQLVTPDVELYDTMMEKKTGMDEVVAKLGVRPDQVVDYMAIIGDSIDNIPGITGVGPKTAAKLIQDFGSLDALIAGWEKIEKPKLRESIGASREQLKRNRELVKLKEDVPLDFGPADLKREPLDADACRKLFTELEFTRLIRDLPAPPLAAVTPAALNTVTVKTPEALAELADALAKASTFSLRVVAQPGDRPIGLGFGLGEGRTFYVPFGHRYLGVQQLNEAAVYEKLKPALESDTPKLGHRLKDDWHALAKAGVTLRGIKGDVELASFLVNSARREHHLADLARERLRIELPGELLETGKKARPLTDALVEQAAAWAGAGADAVLRLHAFFLPELERQQLMGLYRELEVPLVRVLAEMERDGVRVDKKLLASLDADMEKELNRLLKEIYQLAGHEFVVGSTQQLGQVLFDELKLPVQRRTKTGNSVDQETLEKLAESHPLPKIILEHRSLSKLKSTYVDTLPALCDADDRVHTTFNMIGAATGRLSSNDPNLQNIPVRTEQGRQIRAAFVAREGWELVSADYSQIELRILAHFSKDEALSDSFKKDEDVHTRTAAEVFGVALDQVTPEMRRAAKAVNFGIAYGQTSFGLSHRLDIPGADAQVIIDKYFQRYQGVRKWLDETIAQAKREEVVSTLYGRRRPVPDISSRNFALRAAAERIAVNAPIQGTAADIVKRAMLRVDEALAKNKLRSRMLLQVHDELLFEAPVDELDALGRVTRAAMEGAAQLDVPLKVDLGSGKSWAEAH